MGILVNTLVNGEGLSWIGYWCLITAVPLITVGVLADVSQNELPDHVRDAGRFHVRFLRRWRLLIIFISTGGAAALSYATVYPLVMFLRIITPQLLAVLFWSIG
ncbi:hypothetical protein ACVXHA_06580 [Escherichia coli]